MFYKNTSGQKWIVRAVNVTTGVPLAGDASNITAKISIDGAAGASLTDTNPAELEDGFYVFDLTQAETNGDMLLLIPVSVTSNIEVYGHPSIAFTTVAKTDDVAAVITAMTTPGTFPS